jgi:UDP-glucose:(heptosyl)LPS alpha-1,3-glucosyltransferase
VRIALVHMRHAPSGGTEGYLTRLATFLAGRGHEVAIVCRSHGAPPHPAVRFERLRPPAIGAPWRMWSFARAVERWVRAARPDLVVGLGKTWTHDALRLGGGCHASYLELAHAATLGPLERRLGLDRPKQRVALAIERRALAPGAYRAVIANSRMVAADVARRHGVPPERVTVIHNGVDLLRFHPGRREREGLALRRALGLADAAPLVLFLGTGYGRKGLDLALAAFAALHRERPRARLVVVGADSKRRAYEAHARELGVAGATLFLGPRCDPEACYAAADLYVLPTRYDPFANATLEALASGLPVLTSDRNGGAEVLAAAAGEVVSLGAAGDDAGALERALVAWSDPDRLRPASGAARALAEGCGLAREMEATAALLEGLARERSA